MRCQHVQPFREGADARANERCDACARRFARYFCAECKLYDDEPGKDIFHCSSGCGGCRVGRAADFFHCATCGVCMAVQLRGRHRCVERALDSACPVCAEDLAGRSTSPVTVLETCGHAMHTACMDEHLKHSYQCPMCQRSMRDMTETFRRIDELVAKYRCPAEYARFKARVLCLDCEAKSLAPRHFAFHKCGTCGSYNTKVTGHEHVF